MALTCTPMHSVNPPGRGLFKVFYSTGTCILMAPSSKSAHWPSNDMQHAYIELSDVAEPYNKHAAQYIIATSALPLSRGSS